MILNIYLKSIYYVVWDYVLKGNYIFLNIKSYYLWNFLFYEIKYITWPKIYFIDITLLYKWFGNQYKKNETEVKFKIKRLSKEKIKC